MARILIVEDEMLVAMFIEDMVNDLGHQVVGPAMRLETALAVADSEDIDLAILDINLAGKQSFPVAVRLEERGIPFVFASGYGAAGLAEPYRRAPVLKKPFEADQIADILARLLAAPDQGPASHPSPATTGQTGIALASPVVES